MQDVGDSTPKENFLEVVLYGVERALWDALGKSSLAFTPRIGESLCEELEIKACEENFESIKEAVAAGGGALKELGILEDIHVQVDESQIRFRVKGCMLLPIEKRLQKEGIEPFICPIMNAAVYMLRKRLGVRAKLSDINVDVGRKTCEIVFEKL